MLLILAVQSAKIRFYIEKAIFLFNFYDKSLEVSILFLIFATNSVSPFVWVSGLFTGKGRYGTLSLSLKSRKFEYAQEENDNLERPRRVYCNLTYRADCCLMAIVCSVCWYIIMRHDVGYLCCLSFEHRQCESLRLGMDEK